MVVAVVLDAATHSQREKTRIFLFFFIFYIFLSFSIFHFSFIFFHILSYSFIFFVFVGCSKSDFFWASISSRFLLTVLM